MLFVAATSILPETLSVSPVAKGISYVPSLPSKNRPVFAGIKFLLARVKIPVLLSEAVIIFAVTALPVKLSGFSLLNVAHPKEPILTITAIGSVFPSVQLIQIQTEI